MRNREDFDEDFDDDEDEYEDDGEDLSEFDQDALFFNECTLKQINHELVSLPNRELLEFLQWELDKLHFTENSELIPVGIEFQGQYLLQFYNVADKCYAPYLLLHLHFTPGTNSYSSLKAQTMYS